MTEVDPVTPVAPKQGFVLGSKLYDKLQFLVRVVIPGLATLYAALAGFWGFPHVQEVVGTLTALALFLGLLLGQSAKNFVEPIKKGKPVGDFVVGKTDDGKTTTQFVFNSDPSVLEDHELIQFNTVRKENSL